MRSMHCHTSCGVASKPKRVAKWKGGKSSDGKDVGWWLRREVSRRVAVKGREKEVRK